MLLSTFNDWQELRKTDFKDGKLEVDCPECGGEGQTECCECGNYRDCGKFDGFGKLTASEHPGYDPRPLEYLEAARRDIEAYCNWTGKNFEAVFASVEGFLGKQHSRIAAEIDRLKHIEQKEGEAA